MTETDPINTSVTEIVMSDAIITKLTLDHLREAFSRPAIASRR